MGLSIVKLFIGLLFICKINPADHKSNSQAYSRIIGLALAVGKVVSVGLVLSCKINPLDRKLQP